MDREKLANRIDELIEQLVSESEPEQVNVICAKLQALLQVYNYVS